jgi:alanine or glycine:cation symporter, AGCS family
MNFANVVFEHINSFVGSLFFFNTLFFLEGYDLPLVVVWLGIGSLYFTFKFKFVCVRCFKHAIDLTRGAYDKKGSEGEVSHYSALATALAATLGLGNIAGVAIAIATGGPGATFWMVVAGFLGMTAKFVECSLAQIYRQSRPDGHMMGGAMLYLEKGLEEKGWKNFGKYLAIIFSVICVFASMGGGGAFQVNQSMLTISQVFPFFNDHGWLYGLIMTALVGLVIIGGIKSIANVANKIVPFMCILFICMMTYVLFYYSERIPWALQTIISEAFSPSAMYGGFLGVLVIGFRRAAFSNEAGVGSAAIVHSASKTQHPIQEGIVSILEPFIDTVVMCTFTAIVIVVTRAYDNPDYLDLIHSKNGAGITSKAFGQAHYSFPWILCLVVFLFAYATVIAWSYYGERCFTYLFGEKYSMVYKVIFCIVIFMGSITTSTNIMEFGDLMILGMAFPNVIGCFLLRDKVRIKLEEYLILLKSGKIAKVK